MNKLIEWIISQKNEQQLSYRQLAVVLGLSHSNVTNVLKERSPITWDFCAAVAENMGISHMEAFTMAGLLPEGGNNKQGDQAGARPPAEKVPIIIPEITATPKQKTKPAPDGRAGQHRKGGFYASQEQFNQMPPLWQVLPPNV